jgi:RNA polymerase sigma factor for flagellar operon FliA
MARGGEGAGAAEIEARVREGLDVVGAIARSLRRALSPQIDRNELEAAGREGLVNAARSYEPARGVPFRRFAALRIRGAMIDMLRASGALPRTAYRRLRAIEAADRVQEGRLEDDAAAPVATAEAAEKRLEDSLGGMATAMAAGFLAASSDGLDTVADANLSPEAATAEKELVDTLRALIAKRPEAERKLLERHYFDGLTFEDAAKELGLSKSWASRLHARAMQALSEEANRLR